MQRAVYFFIFLAIVAENPADIKATGRLAKLYDALSSDQKKKADELLTGMGCMM